MRNLFGYEVLDSRGESLGTVENVRESGENIEGFMEISTGWLGLGKTRLIPEAGITVDHGAQTVRIAHDSETVKSSPGFESSPAGMDTDLKTRLSLHYGTAESAGTSSGALSAWPAAKQPPSLRDDTIVHLKEGQSIEVPLAEERIKVTKREVSFGEVRLRKVVRTEIVHQPVELRREEVIVERLSPEGVWEAEGVIEGKVISILLSREEAVIEKTVHSAGAVKASKETKAERKTVSGTVRREDVEVERTFVKKTTAAAAAETAKPRGKKRKHR